MHDDSSFHLYSSCTIPCQRERAGAIAIFGAHCQAYSSGVTGVGEPGAMSIRDGKPLLVVSHSEKDAPLSRFECTKHGDIVGL
jgi:hypothetical protein